MLFNQVNSEALYDSCHINNNVINLPTHFRDRKEIQYLVKGETEDRVLFQNSEEGLCKTYATTFVCKPK